MKKLGFVAAVVLVAALVAGCEGFRPPESTGSGNLVKIVLEGDIDGRSLIQSVAESDMDFVEVIFRRFDGTDYETYRMGWKLNSIGSIGIPEDFDLNSTATPCEAVVFGGLNEGKVLLAVGLVSRINGTAYTYVADSPTGGKITGGNTVTFKMAALTSKILMDRATTNFKITGGARVEPTTHNPGDLPSLQTKGKDVPIYVLPKETLDVTAEYEFAFEYKDGTQPTFDDYAQYIIIAPGTGDRVIRQMGTTLEAGYRRATMDNLATTAATFIAGTDPLPSTLEINFDTQQDGLCTIFLRIPVYMFGVEETTPYPPETVRHTKWYIQSGLDNSMLDDGSGE
jgi:hypothetical protein